MKSLLIAAFLSVSVVLTGFSKIWTISDSKLEIRFDDQTALLSVTDKRCKKVWEQDVLQERFHVKKTVQKGNSLTVHLTGKYSLEVQFILTESSSLEVILMANNKMPIEDFAFPSSFISPDKDHYLLITESEGLLLPVDDTEYPLGADRPYFCGGGLAMSWMGVVDAKFNTGYMAILDTPFDATMRTRRENNLVTFEPLWMPSHGEFGYTRKVIYHFFDKGGYTAQAKTYRNYIWSKNNVVTLKEKEKRFPAMEKMIGAVHIYVWDDAREVSFAHELKQSGIDKTLILWDANHTPYPEIGYDDRLKELGFATGGYELFTDLKLRDTVFTEFDEKGSIRFARTSYPGLFHDLVTKKKDGETNFNQFGHTACPAVMRPQIMKRIERELKEFPHETYFLDVYQANGLFECYSEIHPLTRQQFAEEVIKNHKMIEDTYGQYLGGEWGADYTGSGTVYNHGMMTLQRTWWGTGIDKKGTIYYTGDWKSNPRPTQMLGTRVANDTYLKYSINEYTRVPLYELVYHDAIVSSWRWEDGNHHTPEIWWKKDLFNILYGTAPLWSIDRSRWEEYKYTFIESYKDICPWLQQIGYDEMVSHRFVSDDRKIQESEFSSGKKVVVNFGTEDALFEGKVLKAKGFLIF